MKKYIILTLLLSLLVISASAAVITIDGGITLVNQPTTIYLTADSFPQGLSGYNITLSITNPSIATIGEVNFPDWATVNRFSSLPSSSVTIYAADIPQSIQSGSTNVNLASITIIGKETGGVTKVEATINELDDDLGSSIVYSIQGGNFVVRSNGFFLYPGISTDEATEVTTRSVTLNGHTNNESLDVWFEWGSVVGQDFYPYVTSVQKDINGSFSFFLENIKLYTDKTYYYRASCAEGYGEEMVINIPAIKILPETTYGDFADQFNSLDVLDIGAVLEYLPQPFTTAWGEEIFYGFIFATIFIVIWLKTESAYLPAILGLIIGGIIFGVPISPEIKHAGNALLVISLAAMLYTWIMGRFKR